MMTYPRNAWYVAPLSAGKVCDGGRSIERPYHGLRFGADGACLHNPHGDGRIPKAAAVPARAVRERDRLVWSMNPVLLPGDAGAVRVRRKLQQLVTQEQAQ